MTGSTTAVAVIPIVAFLALAAWLALVFHADANPPARGRQAQAPPHLKDVGTYQEQAEEPSRTERRAA
jgi:hypothetical protein